MNPTQASERSRPDRRDRLVGRLEALIVLLAIAVRIAAILVLRSHEVPHSTYEHGEIARNLLAGRGFSVRFLGSDGPTSQQAPLYPFCVAAAYLGGGVGTPRALLLLSMGQALLSGLLILGIFRLACRVAPECPLASLLAGMMVALHPTLIYATTHVQVALLGSTLLIWVLAWAYRTGETGRSRDAAIAGILLGLLALTDPILGLSFVGAAIAIFAGRIRGGVSIRRGFGPTAWVAVVAGVVIAPWIARNYRVHGEFVAIKSTFGYAFWQGNCDLSRGTDKVIRPSVETVLRRDEARSGLAGMNRTLWAARHEAGYIDDIALTREDYARLGSVSEPERSRILFRRALDDLCRRPWRYGELSLRRLRYFVFFDETNPKTRAVVYRVGHLGLTLIGIVGILLAGRRARRRLMPTFVTAGLITLFHVLTITSARFHIPLEPLLAVWGGIGLSNLGGLLAPAGSAPVAGEFVSLGIECGLGVGMSPGV